MSIINYLKKYDFLLINNVNILRLTMPKIETKIVTIIS